MCRPVQEVARQRPPFLRLRNQMGMQVERGSTDTHIQTCWGVYLPVLSSSLLNHSICDRLPRSLLAGGPAKQAEQALLLPLHPGSSLPLQPFRAALVILQRLCRHGLREQHMRQLRHCDIIQCCTGCGYGRVALAHTWGADRML